jgi:hypothetical protein
VPRPLGNDTTDSETQRYCVDDHPVATVRDVPQLVAGIPSGPVCVAGSMTTLDAMEDQEREAARMRLEILRGLQTALASWPATSSAIWEAADRQAAVAALQNDIGLTENAAQHVLDLPQSRTTRQARADLDAEANELIRRVEGGRS